MNVYVAAHDRWAACHVASVLQDAGHGIVSTWHGQPFHPTAAHTEEQRRLIALQDACEVADADALVLVACPDRVPGGKFVEAGIALGLGKPVLVLGHRENMLLWHPDVRAFDTPQEVADALLRLPPAV